MFSITHSWTHFTMARGGNSLTAVQSAERGEKKHQHIARVVSHLLNVFFCFFFPFCFCGLFKKYILNVS